MDATLRCKPKGKTHWTCPVDGRGAGRQQVSVNNIWQSQNLKPYRVKTFKLLRDARFLERISGKEYSAGAEAGVLEWPDKNGDLNLKISQSCAQRLCLQPITQVPSPVLDSNDLNSPHYKRNGTTTLFAALEVLQGRVIGECQERHQHQEFLRFSDG